MEPIGNEDFSFPPQPSGSNTCGAYAMAYWWGRHQSSPKTAQEIETKAWEYYREIQFKNEDFIAAPDYDEGRLQSCVPDQNSVLRCLGYVIPCCVSGRGGGYCNPQKMMKQIMQNMQKVTCEFYLGCDPLIWAIYVKLKSIAPDIARHIRPMPYDENEQRDMLEVVSVKGGVGLHYLYVFSEDGVRKAIDPVEGLKQGQKAERRDTVMERYNKTQAAIVIG